MFFQQHPAFFGNVEAFFFPSDPAGPEQLQTFLEQRPRLLQEALQRIVPTELQDTLDIKDWGWVSELFDEPQGRFHLATEEVRTTVASLEAVRKKLVTANKSSDYILRTINTIHKRPLIKYLANRNILPKYGFPVDVVKDDVLQAARDRVDGRCGCGGGPAGPGDTSCYGCLRNYRNQFCHDQLSRGEVFRFLQNALC